MSAEHPGLICQECGNDDAAHGFTVCSDCLPLWGDSAIIQTPSGAVMSLDERLGRLHYLRSRVDDEITVLSEKLRRREEQLARLAVAERLRRRKRRRPSNQQPPCGTEEGYQYHRYRDQPRDPECTAAHALHVAARAAEKRAAGGTP